jgi:hypothetical protein
MTIDKTSSSSGHFIHLIASFATLLSAIALLEETWMKRACCG